MKALLITMMVSLIGLNGTAQQRTVKGKVMDASGPIQNVNIKVVDKETSTITDHDGMYEIPVETGDKLQYSYTGLRTIEIRIEDVTRFLNPVMVPDVEELEEVIVEGSKRRSQKDMKEDYSINKRIIKTAWGYLDADRAAGNIRTMSEDEVTIVNLDLPTLLSSRYPFISIKQGGWVEIRGWPALYDIDGQIFAPTLLPGGELTQAPQINIANIKRIGIITNLAATATYGQLGKGGVVVINTIVGNPKSNKVADRARLRNNFVKGDVLKDEDVLQNAPNYLQELVASSSFDAAKDIFKSYGTTLSNSPYFYLDAYRYFVDKWNELAYADQIIAENQHVFSDNPVLLKALAYCYEEQGRFKKAFEAYKDVFILRPNYAQSYMDLANGYRDIKAPKRAATMYARYQYLLEEGFLELDTLGFGPIWERESNNLLSLHGNEVVQGKKAKKLYVAKEDFEGTRLVFQWNDGEAEFELQFVNPVNQYHTWKHSLADNPSEISREKEYGYNVKEYLVDRSLPGLWKVNVKYLGNKSLTPTYLKVTVYHDYGSKSQQKETNIYKLDLKNVNHKLFTISVQGNVAAQ